MPKLPISERLNLSINEAAQYLGVSGTAVYNHLLHQPDFPAYRIGERWLIPRAALEKWNAEQVNREEVRP